MSIGSWQESVTYYRLMAGGWLDVMRTPVKYMVCIMPNHCVLSRPLNVLAFFYFRFSFVCKKKNLISIEQRTHRSSEEKKNSPVFAWFKANKRMNEKENRTNHFYWFSKNINLISPNLIWIPAVAVSPSLLFFSTVTSQWFNCHCWWRWRCDAKNLITHVGLSKYLTLFRASGTSAVETWIGFRLPQAHALTDLHCAKQAK